MNFCHVFHLHFSAKGNVLFSVSALYHVADYSKRIVKLDVGWCQEITIEAVIKVSRCCVKTLRDFRLMRCDKVS